MKLMSILGVGLADPALPSCGECARLEEREKEEVRFLIRMADGLERNIEAVIARSSLGKRGWRRTMARTGDLRRLLSDVLARLLELGVRRMAVTEKIDLSRHEIQLVFNSPRMEDEGRLVSVLIHGYETLNGTVVRPGVVSAMRYVPRSPYNK